jgi:hypothetical protein
MLRQTVYIGTEQCTAQRQTEDRSYTLVNDDDDDEYDDNEALFLLIHFFSTHDLET